MSEYKVVLHKWAKQFVEANRPNPDVQEITRVEFREVEESGYCETCYDPGYTAIEITYLDSSGNERFFYEASYGSEGFKMGTILQELFEIAREEDECN